MVGRHAQIIPTLISTLDQMIDGVDSSDLCQLLEICTARIPKAALVLT